MRALALVLMLLGLLVVGAATSLAQDNGCSGPIELLPDNCWPQPSPMPTATAWPTYDLRPYPGAENRDYPAPVPH